MPRGFQSKNKLEAIVIHCPSCNKQIQMTAAQNRNRVLSAYEVYCINTNTSSNISTMNTSSNSKSNNQEIVTENNYENYEDTNNNIENDNDNTVDN